MKPVSFAAAALWMLAASAQAQTASACQPWADVSVGGRQVYVVKVGSYYVLKDPTVWSGEWYLTMTTDREFNVLSKYTG